MKFDQNDALCCNYVAWNDDSFTCDLIRGDQVAPEMNTRTQIVSTAYVFYLNEEEKSEEKESTFDLTSIGLSSFNWANTGLLILELVDIFSPIWILILWNVRRDLEGFWNFGVFLSIWLIVFDIVSIYMIVTKKPFIFFESSALEKSLLLFLAIDNMFVSMILGIIIAILSILLVFVIGYYWFILISIIIMVNLWIFSVDLGQLFFILFLYKTGDELEEESKFEQYSGDKD